MLEPLCPLQPSYLGKISGSWSRFPRSTRLALERWSISLLCEIYARHDI